MSRSPVAPPRPYWATVLLLLLALGVGASTWWPVYESRAFLVAVAVAAVAGVAIGLAGARFRWPLWLTAVVTVAAFLVLGVPAAVPSRALWGVLPTPQGLAELVPAVALSWKQLVTIAIPVGSYRALLVPVFLLTLLAGVSAALLAFRSRYPAAALLGPVVVFGAGIALGSPRGSAAVWTGIALLVVIVVWLLHLAQSRRRGSRLAGGGAAAGWRRVLGATAMLGVAALLAGAAAVQVPDETRTVVRTEIRPPFEPRSYASPLAGFRASFRPETREEPMLEVLGLPEGAPLRVAALDSYDGVVYSVGGGSGGRARSGEFTRVPYRIDRGDVAGEQIELRITVLGYAEPWVPGVGRLERVVFAGDRAERLGEGFFYNDTTSTGAAQGGLSRGDRYTSRSVLPHAPGELSELRPGTAVIPGGVEPPEEVQRLLDRWAPSSATPGERLEGLVDGLRREGYVSHGQAEDAVPSRSGHALDRLADLADARPMVGDDEQYAVVAALLARQIGFPARVVVGYRGGERVGETTVFRGADRAAWIEVQDASGVWVTIDPNPVPREIPEREPDQPTSVSRPQSVLPPPADHTPVDDVSDDPDQPPEERPDDEPAWLERLWFIGGVVGVSLLGLALLASPFLAVIAAKSGRRRARRRDADAVRRVEGGWEEFADAARDYGYAIPPGATRAEQAAFVGGLGPLVLAAAVDRAVFAPAGPAAEEEDRVWRTVAELERELAVGRRRRDRLRALVSLASFGRYAGSRRGGVRP